MLKRTVRGTLVAEMMLVSVLAFSQATGASQGGGPVKSGCAPVNGLKMYYEIHGSGEPLILLHGGWDRRVCSAKSCRRSPVHGR
jgi:hypothetical protein